MPPRCHFLTLLTVIATAAGFLTASAAPYIVYSGTVTTGSFSALGTTKATTTVYLLTDLADTSDFAILQTNATNHYYMVVGRPSDNPPAGEANTNFFGGVVASTGKAGMAAFSFKDSYTDGNGNIFVAKAYATGALTLSPTSLVPARPRPVNVTLKTDGTVLGVYQFTAPTSAITSGANACPKSISGTLSNYVIGSPGSLASFSTTGSFSLSIDPTMTALANIGGGFISGRNSAAILPVVVPDGTTAADDFVAWLSSYAEVGGFGQPFGAISGLPLKTQPYLTTALTGQLYASDAVPNTNYTVNLPSGILTLGNVNSVPVTAMPNYWSGFKSVTTLGGPTIDASAGPSVFLQDPNNGWPDELDVNLPNLDQPSVSLSCPNATVLFPPVDHAITSTSSSPSSGAITNNVAAMTFSYSNSSIESIVGVIIDLPLQYGGVECTGGTLTGSSGTYTYAGGTLITAQPEDDGGFSANGGTLSLDASSGTGLTKAGGTWIFGSSHNYSGGTTINGGTLGVETSSSNSSSTGVLQISPVTTKTTSVSP
jgi:autotransporter-associated beta strand protein